MIKIDAKQFEQDLKRKTLEQLHELRDSAPVFQSAYDELIKAVEFLEKEDYAEAITNAGKSYESIMKIICGADKGNAGELTKQIVSDEIQSTKPQDSSEQSLHELAPNFFTKNC